MVPISRPTSAAVITYVPPHPSLTFIPHRSRLPHPSLLSMCHVLNCTCAPDTSRGASPKRDAHGTSCIHHTRVLAIYSVLNRKEYQISPPISPAPASPPLRFGAKSTPLLIAAVPSYVPCPQGCEPSPTMLPFLFLLSLPLLLPSSTTLRPRTRTLTVPALFPLSYTVLVSPAPPDPPPTHTHSPTDGSLLPPSPVVTRPAKRSAALQARPQAAPPRVLGRIS